MAGEVSNSGDRANAPISDPNAEAAREKLSAQFVAEVDKAKAKLREPDEFLPFAANQFTRIDTNRDGFITRPEIETFAARPNMRPEQIALASVLRENFDRLAALSGNTKAIDRSALYDFATAAEPSLCTDNVTLTGTVGRSAAGGAAGGAIASAFTGGDTWHATKQGAGIGAAIGLLAYAAEKTAENERKAVRANIASWGYFDLKACN